LAIRSIERPLRTVFGRKKLKTITDDSWLEGIRKAGLDIPDEPAAAD
jgi:hypothetical protein